MIYTITLNPSLDYVVQVDYFRDGKLNRTKEEKIYPGGKGINVSLMLQTLGYKSTALGFIAGATGDMLFNLVEDTGIYAEFVEVPAGSTRINVKVESDQETEINARGPVITADDMNRLFDCLDKIKKNDILVMSGNIPLGLPKDIYGRIMAMVADKHVRCVLDTSGDMMKEALKFHPFLIKPNDFEIAELTDIPLLSINDVVKAARKLQSMGAQNVIVSRGQLPPVMVTDKDEVLTAPVPRGQVINTVGAGDSMIAGWLAEYLRSGDMSKALIFATVAGSATAFSPWIATRSDVDCVLQSITQG